MERNYEMRRLPSERLLIRLLDELEQIKCIFYGDNVKEEPTDE